MGLRASCLVAIAVLGAAAMISGGATAAPETVDLSLAKLAPVACPFHAPARVRCSTLEVPENWSLGAGSKRIRILVATVAAADSAARLKDPIVLLPGGPGVSSLFSLPLIASSPAGRDRDIIVVESRGYGYSEPALSCNGVDDLAACYRRWTAQGVDVEQYRSIPSTHDVEALRRALRLGPWNVLGVSFGAYYALQYERLYPEALRSVTLDSGDTMQAGYDWTRPSTLNAFARVFDDCQADPACNKAYPDLRNRFIATMRDAERSPETYQGQPVTAARIFDRLYLTMYYSFSLRFTPMLVDAAARKDYATLFASRETAESEGYGPFDPTRRSALGLNAATLCGDDNPSPGVQEARVPYKNPWPEDIKADIRPEGWDFARRCASWPVRPTPPELTGPVQSDLPTLLLSGSYDPICPTEYSEAIALHLDHPNLVVDPSSSHSVLASGNPCILQTYVDFLRDPHAPVRTGCALRIAPVDWAISSSGAPAEAP